MGSDSGKRVEGRAGRRCYRGTREEQATANRRRRGTRRRRARRGGASSIIVLLHDAAYSRMIYLDRLGSIVPTKFTYIVLS
eukprot:SAG31_NODE_7153_length_1772_cov_1.913329_2_plen_81_part_00